MPKQIILVRHGETSYNKERRIQGWLDIPLSDDGHLQAQAAANKFSQIQVDAIYSSDLLRARQTAHHIYTVTGKPINLSSHLRERDMGIFAGWSWETERDAQKDKLWEGFQKSQDTNDRTWNKHKGESINHLLDRIGMFFAQLSRRHKDQTVVIVTHFGTINYILEHLGLKTATDGLKVVGNGSLLVLTKNHDHYDLQEI